MHKSLIASCLAFLLIGIGVHAREQSSGRTTSERLIAEWGFLSRDGEEQEKYEKPERWDEFVFSPDRKRLAYAATLKHKPGLKYRKCVVLDGIEGAKYYSVWGLTFSPDSSKLAYRATFERHTTISDFKRSYSVVLDGVEGKRYDRIADLTFSPDSSKMAYIAETDGKWSVVLDGVEGKRCDRIANLTFSPDSSKMAYITESDGKWSVVLNGEAGKHYDSIGNNTLIFSADSKHMVYTARMDAKWTVVVDGREGKQYDGVMALAPPEYSPDSKRLAYAAKLGHQCIVVEGAKEGKQYDGIGLIVFSPNSEHMAYTAVMGDREFVVMDGKEQKHYDGVANIIFSPDSTRIAYAAKEGDTWFHVVDGQEPPTNTDTLLLETGDKRFATILDADVPKQNYIMSTAPCITLFSPDSKRLAVHYRSKGMAEPSMMTECVVLDGKMHKTYSAVGNLTFSPDSKHLGYNASFGRLNTVFSWYRPELALVFDIAVVDGKEVGKYKRVSDIAFSPDGRRMAYMAMVEEELFVVVDGEELAKYDSDWYLLDKGMDKFGRYMPKIIFDSPNSFHYLASKNNSIYLVEERLE